NTDERLASDLYRIARAAPEASRQALDRLVEQMCQSLLERRKTPAGSLVALLEGFRTSYAEEQKQAAAAPAYSVSNIQKLRQQQAAGRAAGSAPQSQAPTAEDGGLLAFGLQAFLSMGFAAWLIWLLVISPLLPAIPKVPGASPAPASRLPAGNRQIIEGKVVAVATDGIVVAPVSGGEPVLIRNRNVTPGATLKLRVRPLPPSQGKPQAELVEFY
ncbi:hypothetical protein KBA41_00615, partial [Candidatus Ozemobacteraceae bacterium]|nr:hypothetical protein [Candidatus Ozemobacteraceae bacterium]